MPNVNAVLAAEINRLSKRVVNANTKVTRKLVEVLARGRFRAMGVKAHRRKLGLSLKHYAKLVGVGELTIFNWESEKFKPHQSQKAKWLAIRGLGKREALERLGTEGPSARAKNRRTFKVTAEELILRLLKERKVLTTSQLAAAWKKAGRGGTVDHDLSRMVKAKKLKRKPLGGKRGSAYRAA